MHFPPESGQPLRTAITARPGRSGFSVCHTIEHTHRVAATTSDDLCRNLARSDRGQLLGAGLLQKLGQIRRRLKRFAKRKGFCCSSCSSC